MKRLLIGLSVLFNVITVAGVGGLYYITDGFAFIRMQQERLRSLYETLPIEEGDVVFLGDSITEGGAWDELFPGIPAKNRGIGGDTSEGVLDRLETITRGKPSKVFLKIGTNDLAMTISAEDISTNVGTILDRIHRESPGTQVYVQSVLPRDSWFTPGVQELNRLLEKVAVAHDATWIDVFPLFVDADGGAIRSEYANDRLHLMGPAYVVWRDALDPYVRN
ncbi:MAG: GDSL-type esterase/lipase family protein [Candidatus Binatia bacterium]|nr:GDSL-type esterase/lipase family protein [Candidatus Binatia bacterium]